MSKKFRISYAQKMLSSFVLLALFGAILLCLPISNSVGGFLAFDDALFVAVSAVTTTGLSTVVITDFTLFGQIVIVILMQIGALGFMAFATLFLTLMKMRLSIKDRLSLQNDFGDGNVEARTLLKHIFLLSFVIEAAGSLMLMPYFIYKLGYKGIYIAIFETISAFSCSGFHFTLDVPSSAYVDNVLVALPMLMVMILGSLSFAVIVDILKARKKSRLSINTKIVLFSNIILWAFAFVCFFIFEYSGAFKDYSLWEKIVASFFQSVNSRATGYDGIDQSSLSVPSRALTMLLIFIGASPASTGGGIKVTTFAIIMIGVFSSLRGQDEIVINKHTIGKKLLIRAVVTTVFMGGIILISHFFLGAVEMHNPNITSESLFFEVISAMATSGLSMGATIYLSSLSKIVLCVSMLAGRLGTLTLAMAIGKQKEKLGIGYPDANIMLG